MLEYFFSDTATLLRFRDGSVGPFLDGFAGLLFAQGYKRLTGRVVLRSARHLGEWAARHGVGVADFDDEVIARFERVVRARRGRQFGGRKRGFHEAPGHARRFLHYLREVDGVPAAPVAPRAALTAEYAAWMRDRQGLAAATIAAQLRVVDALLGATGDDPARLDVTSVRTFVLDHVQRHSPSSPGGVTTPVRGFIRYLVAQGRCAVTLVGAVPVMHEWKQARLPQYLTAVDVERVIAGCSSGDDVSVRDRAMLLLLARLGLRGSDVRMLQLDDLDWRRGRIRVAGKGRRETFLPLPQDVGDAILAYLRVRQSTQTDRVFLRKGAPVQPLSSGGLKNAVERAIRRAGVQAPAYGTHLLRHSLATRMLREGATLDLIGAVLRHRDLDSTAIYSKVDVEQLRHIAQPWPGTEVSPC